MQQRNSKQNKANPKKNGPGGEHVEKFENKTKRKRNSQISVRKDETKLLQHERTHKQIGRSPENTQIMAVVSMLYWEVARNVFEEALDCDNFTPICNKIAKSILSSCEIFAEDGVTFSEEVILQIKMYAFYISRSHLSIDIEKSKSLFEQLTIHMKQFYFHVPEKPLKLSGNGKKKEEVAIKHYIVNGDIPGHFATTSTRLGVVDYFTLREAQEFLNKQAQIPPLTPMIWFIGKFEGVKFVVVDQLEPKRKLLDVKHKLKKGEEIYYSSLLMELAEEEGAERVPK